MKQFEKIFEDFPIPEKEDIFFEKRLRGQLIDRFVRPDKNYLLHYRIAAGIACFFAFFTFIMLFFPAQNQQNFASQNQLQPSSHPDLDTATLIEEVLHYTGADNPNVPQSLGNEQLSEDKTYRIRRYITKNHETVTIVTEVNSQVQPVPVRRQD